MRYTDGRGRDQRLTREQANYLDIAARGGFDRGWGGLSSTLTVRLLEERGLINLRRYHGGQGWPRWRVTSATKLGEQVLTEWEERRAAEGVAIERRVRLDRRRDRRLHERTPQS